MGTTSNRNTRCSTTMSSSNNRGSQGFPSG
jgi:hypothetical protein